MPTILKIGYQTYMVKNDAAAMAAMKALCGAVKVKSRHIHLGKRFREVFWPDEDETEIAVKTVMEDQLVRSDPGEREVFEEPKQLPYRT